MTKRSRIVTFGSCGLLIAAGVAGAATLDGTAGQAVAIVLISLGLVLATSLVFFEVGLSEDRERARLERAREQLERPRRRVRRQRPHLDRMRGRARRLQ